jgi:hypothetical protein
MAYAILKLRQQFDSDPAGTSSDVGITVGGR